MQEADADKCRGRGKQTQKSLLRTASVETPTEAWKNGNYKQKLALFVHGESQHASSVKFFKEIHREATTTPTISGSNDSYHNATTPAYFHATRHVYTMLLCKPWQSTMDMHLSSYDSTSREGGVASRGDKGGGMHHYSADNHMTPQLRSVQQSTLLVTTAHPPCAVYVCICILGLRSKGHVCMCLNECVIQ